MDWIEKYYLEKDELLKYKNQFSYDRILFKDRVEQYPNRIRHEDMGDGTVLHHREPGNIYQAGTPLSAGNLGYMDLGLYLLYARVAEMESMMQKVLIEVASLKGAALNNMPSNQFFITFDTLESIEVLDGWYDKRNRKVVNG